jgi:hypothetical protein
MGRTVQVLRDHIVVFMTQISRRRSNIKLWKVGMLSKDGVVYFLVHNMS